MLLGHWVEDQLASARRRPSRRGVAAGIIAPLVVLGLVAATALSGKHYAGALRALRGSSWSLGAIAPSLIVTGGIALAAIALVVLGPSWPRRRAPAIAGLVVADLLVFPANQSSLAPVYARALDTSNSLQAKLAAKLGPDGRYLIVNQHAGGVALTRVGAPDVM